MPSLDTYKNHPIYLYTEDKLKTWEKINKKTCVYIEGHINNLTKIKEDIKKFNQKYNIFTADLLTDDMFVYIYILSFSRRWNGIGLVPFADLFQHSNNSITLLDIGSQKCSLNMKEEYGKDTEIFVNYGIFDECSTYANFGFIDRIDKINNINRYIKLNLIKEYNSSSSTLDIIKQLEVREYNSVPKIYYLTNKGIQTNLLEYLKILTKDKDDIKRSLDGLDVSLNNYRLAYQLLFKILNSEDIVIKNEEIEELKNNLKKYDPLSVEWHLSYLSIVMFNIIITTLNTIYASWINELNSPFSIQLKIEI